MKFNIFEYFNLKKGLSGNLTFHTFTKQIKAFIIPANELHSILLLYKFANMY